MSVASQYQKIIVDITNHALKAGRDPRDITLVAVTKNYPLSHVLPAYDLGCRDFGENRVDEALEKIASGPHDLQWHFIGNLQSKKVNKVVGHFSLVHSVDSLKLAEKIASSSARGNVTTKILLQANTSGEEAKQGLSPNEWKKSFVELLNVKGISILGLMTMAPCTNEETVVRHCFSELRLLRDELEAIGKIKLPHLSMGMSNDYRIAIEEGATILRIGSSIFQPDVNL